MSSRFLSIAACGWLVAGCAPQPTLELPGPKVLPSPRVEMPRTAQPGVSMFPELPKKALGRGQQGVIGLRVLVDETGNVAQAIVARSTGHKELDELAIATASSWKLRPGRIDGVATSMWVCYTNTYYIRSLISYEVTAKDVEEMTAFWKACDEDMLKLAPGAVVGLQVPRAMRSHPLRQPPHPPESKARGEQGIVGLLVYVNESGKVTHVRVGKSTGYKTLDDAAVSTLPTWQLQPGSIGDVPTAMWSCFLITFSVDQQRPYRATANDRQEIDTFNRMCDQERLKRHAPMAKPEPE